MHGTLYSTGYENTAVLVPTYVYDRTSTSESGSAIDLQGANPRAEKKNPRAVLRRAPGPGKLSCHHGNRKWPPRSPTPLHMAIMYGESIGVR